MRALPQDYRRPSTVKPMPLLRAAPVCPLASTLPVGADDPPERAFLRRTDISAEAEHGTVR